MSYMQTSGYLKRRGEIETYFDRTALAAWEKLTSDAPVGRIRATVRAGRDAMRATLLAMLPEDLSGMRVLDAGCGTGALALAAARRGADVLAIDLSPQLVTLAERRIAGMSLHGRIAFRAGDMLDETLGRFDFAVAMDSLIHYRRDDAVAALARLAPRIDRSILFTFAPRTRALAMMHVVGSAFPRGNRAPSIEPQPERLLRSAIALRPELARFAPARTQRIASGFYISQALELSRQARGAEAGAA